MAMNSVTIYIDKKENRDRLLKDVLGQLPLQDGSGKPYIPGGSVNFNLSHSGSILVLAVSESLEVGIDLEQLENRRSNPDYMRLAERFFTEEEAEYIASSGLSDFIRIWTMKEACVKLKGTGIAGGLNRFTVVQDGCIMDFADEVVFKDIKLPLREAFACTLATYTKPDEIKLINRLTD